jgi:ribosomal protein S18 acetylase RimI-like enzyme
MQALASVAIADDPDCFPLHPGDIAHRMFSGLRFERSALAELARLWEEDGELVAWALLYPKHAAFDLLVHPEYRLQYERSLLSVTEAALVEAMERREESKSELEADASRCDHRRLEALRSLGWSGGSHEYTVTRRSLDDVSDPELPEGLTIRSVRGVEEAVALAEVHSGSFGSTWTSELYRRVMESPGYAPEREIVVETPDGRLAGFTETWYDEPNRLGLFEPVGTHEDFRRLGVGRALMCAGMQAMAAAGMEHAIVTHEAGNEASTALYAATGFTPVMEVGVLRKPIPD